MPLFAGFGGLEGFVLDTIFEPMLEFLASPPALMIAAGLVMIGIGWASERRKHRQR